MNIERFSAQIHGVSDGEEGTFRGVCASLGIASSARGPVRFSKAALAGAPSEVPLLLGHDPAEPLGLASLSFDPHEGLIVHGKLALALQKAREMRSLLMMGATNGLSVGFTEKRSHYEGNVRVIDAAVFAEVSLVTSPADPCATVKHVHRSGETIYDFLDPTARAKREYLLIKDLQRAAQARHGGGWFG